MQLFGLVNTLLSIDSHTAKKDLSIRRFPVIPLSQNTGLIGWVSNSDTLHQLIKDYRVEAGIIENIEFKLVNEMCEHFAQCPLINKVEIFRNALEKTVGEDIQKVLWVKSSNSEIWLERRTSYTRSLAVMSMVGYILGLGDRHPSNIMLERHTGKIVHIDFGDCFEIAMRREKFPERIPFRLTRMLTKAMEVSGIEGNFRTTCENTIRVMRDSRESLLAIMEAFVYDPLISFRLLNPKMLQQIKDEHEAAKKKKNEEEKKSGDKPASPSNHDSADQVLAQIEINRKNQEREEIIDTVTAKLHGP
jgi:FKBP12-rapamycin complex-associated protein